MRRAWVILGVLLVGCGGSDAASSTTPVTTVAATTTTQATTATTSTTTIAATTTTQPAGVIGLNTCRDAVPIDLATSLDLQTIAAVIDACDVQDAVNDLRNDDVGYALLTFGIELDKAKLLLEGDQFDDLAQIKFTSAVLTFLTAVHKYLGY